MKLYEYNAKELFKRRAYPHQMGVWPTHPKMLRK